MTVHRVTDVARPRGTGEEVRYSLDEPREGSVGDTYALSVQGWVLGSRVPAVAVDVMLHGRCVARLPIRSARPDIGRKHPDIPWSGHAGFRGEIGTLKLPSAFELRFVARLKGERRLPLAVVRGERRLPSVETEGFIQPIALTTLGRSGSTWVTRLLGRHPGILSYRPFEYEARMASYWLEVLTTLSEPASYRQALRGHLTGDLWWAGTNGTDDPATRPVDSALEGWLSRRHTDTLAAHGAWRIEEFYRRVAAQERRESATHFVEKFSPGSFVQNLLWDLYPRTREVFLIRDFRDVVCSILAYNEKRGLSAFGRDRASDDVSYVHQLRTSVHRMLESWTARADRAFLLRYEDLVTRPRETLAGLLEYLGGDSREETVERILDEARRMTPDAQEQHRTTPSVEASIGRWRRDLEPELVLACQEAYADALADFGYARDEPVAARPSS